MGTQGEVTICKPRREASGETNPDNTLTLDFSLQNGGKTNACGLRPRGGGILFWSPDTNLLQVMKTLAFWCPSLSSECGEESITQLL